MKNKALPLPFKRIIMFSGGAGSWACAKHVAARYGTKDMVLLFADTLIEDEDLYRFLDEASNDIGIPITKVSDGRTPWKVFEDVRFIGNSRVDPCSRILKRELLAKWREENCHMSSITYFGIDWTEKHRLDTAAERHNPWAVEAPLCGPPFKTKQEYLQEMRACGIEPPRLYGMGFGHNNCGGFCCKAGHAHFRLLLEKMPERYREHELQEARLRDLGIKGTILRSRKGGKTTPITLTKFREMCLTDQDEKDDLAAGCGCALG